MKIKKPFQLLGVPLLMLGVSCGGNSDDSNSSTQTSAFNAAYEQLVESSPQFGAGKKYIFPRSVSPKASFSTWDNASTAFWNMNDQGLNPKDYVGYMLNEENDQSIFERARMPFLISCCMDILANKDGDLLAEGTQTFTFTDAVVGVCGDESDFTSPGGSMIGQTITIEVTNLTDTTNYDQMVKFPDASNDLFEADQWMYVRNTDSLLNFMHIEGDSTNFFASSISFDKATEGGFFQYLSLGTNQENLYRIYMDPANDLARIYAYTKLDNANETNYFTITSTFTGQTHAAISMSYENIAAPYDTDLADANACVDTSNGAIETDNTLTCTANSRTTLASSGASGLITEIGTFSAPGLITDADAGNLDDNLPEFDETTILTAPIGL